MFVYIRSKLGRAVDRHHDNNNASRGHYQISIDSRRAIHSNNESLIIAGTYNGVIDFSENIIIFPAGLCSRRILYIPVTRGFKARVIHLVYHLTFASCRWGNSERVM